jgi:hypothetical protein
MRHILRLLAIALTLLLTLAAFLVGAQDELPVTVQLTDGYSIRVPEGWAGRRGMNDGFIISDGTSFLYVMDPTVVAGRVDAAAAGLIQEVLIALFRLQYRADARPADISAVTIADLPAAVYEYSLTPTFKGTFVVVETDDSTYALFDLNAPADSQDDPLVLLESVVATLVEGEVQNVPVLATAVPCFVAATADQTVAVRIGPGVNRAIILFMPADIEVRANGFYTDPGDSSEWFRIVKAQIAPDVAADELWVARADITESGDCTNLTRIDARAIIPPAPPITAIRTTSGPASGAGAEVPADPNAAVGTVPLPGAWTFAYDTTAYQSCRGSDTSRTNTADVLQGLPLTVSSPITVAGDGRSFRFYGTTYTLQADGVYLGSATYGGGVSAQTRLRVLSSSSMSGEFVINAVGTDFACSITIYVSMRRG